jgi:hypothetical protein
MTEYLACAPKEHQQAPADTPHTHTRTLQPAAARVEEDAAKSTAHSRPI